ncbi:sensor histidine kinase [Aquipuribacter sp. SD81]|uniref:sensor histidine kinase n=1 Tax=Aquipuribacter sp. SD81 TaxID=3127703 RepID=UPI00301A63A1
MSTPTYPGLRLPDLAGAAARPGALLAGILVVRWCVCAWLVLLLVLGEGRLHVPLGVAAVVVTAGWTLLLTLRRPAWGPAWLAADLALCAGLLVVAAVAPSLATVYPVAAAVTWGAVRGARGGALAGAVLGVVYVLAHVVEGLTLAAVDESVLDVAGDAFSLVLAGTGVGLVSTLVQRSAARLRAAEVARLRATEEAARLAEREGLARAVHDSVLQSLALVHKRGRELAAEPAPAPAAVQDLADLAARQERHLRELLLRSRQAPGAEVPLREALLDVAAGVPGLDVQVTTLLGRPLPPTVVDAVAAAVAQCLANTERHAGTPRAWVYAEDEGEELVVSVRDDGAGFVHDPARLDREGRMGLRHSVAGRVADLGGRTTVTSTPGRGTEVELRVPLPPAGPAGEDA